MSGKQSKRDRKIAKIGAEQVMHGIREQWKIMLRPKARWMPTLVYRWMVRRIINTDKMSQ